MDEDSFESKLNQPILDYSIIVTSEDSITSNERGKQILAIERIGITVAYNGRNTIVVRGQEYIINQLREFDWVIDIKLYNCYIKFAAIH